MTADFRLKNGHRTSALRLAVDLLAQGKRAKALYDALDELRIDILHDAWKVLAHASSRHDGFADFIAEGLATTTASLDLGPLATGLDSRVALTKTERIWPRLLQRFEPETDPFEQGGLVVARVDGQPPRDQMPDRVVHFRDAAGKGRLPQATIACATRIDLSDAPAGVHQAQDRLRRNAGAEYQARLAALKAVYDVVPAIAATINDVETADELVDRFPAARSLFAREVPTPADDAASRLLRTLA